MTASLRAVLLDCSRALTTARLHYEAQAKPDDRRRTAHLAEQAGELVGRIDGELEEVEMAVDDSGHR